MQLSREPVLPMIAQPQVLLDYWSQSNSNSLTVDAIDLPVGDNSNA